MSATILIRPKQTAVREAWQYKGEPLSEFPNWVKFNVSRLGSDEIVLHRRSGTIILNIGEWLVRDLDSADVIQYTDAELWEEFERS